MNKNKMLAVIGIIICLAGTIVMVEVYDLGMRTTTVAIVLLITGISLIATSGGLFQQKKPLTANQKKIMIGLLVATVIAVLVTFLFSF